MWKQYEPSFLTPLLDWRHQRRYPPPLREPHTVIYDWRPYRGFHILNTFAGALRIAASPDDQVDEILRRIPPSVDTFLFNLDVSYTERWPAERAKLIEELRRRGIDVWNAKATDTRKQRVQEVCRQAGLATLTAGPEGDPEEMLIVKSDANYSGISERALTAKQRNLLGIGGATELFATKEDYRIVPRREVRPEWWRDPLLTIERFVGNSENRWYRVRWVFDTRVISDLISRPAVKTVENSSWQQVHIFRRGDPVALPLRMLEVSDRIIDAFGIEYGALDVLPDENGEMFVLDVNPAPGLTAAAPGQSEAFRSAWEERRARVR